MSDDPAPRNERGAESPVHRRTLLFLSLVGIGILVRVGLRLVFTDVADPSLHEFGVIARNLVETGAYSYRTAGIPDAYMPPGYPLAIAALYSLFGVGPAAHVVLALVLLCAEIAIPLLVGWIALTVWGRPAAVVACILALFWPRFLLMSGASNSIALSLTVLLAACGVLVARNVSLRRKAATCGLLLGVYVLFRFEAIPFSLAFLWFFVNAQETPNATLRARLSSILLFVVGFLVPTTPWLVRNYCVFDQVVWSTSGGFNLLRGHNPDATGKGNPWPSRRFRSFVTDSAGNRVPSIERGGDTTYVSPADALAADRLNRDMALDHVRTHPVREAELPFLKLFFFLAADFSQPLTRFPAVWLPSVVAFVVGLAFWFRHGRRSREQTVLWLIFALQAAIVMIFFMMPRYRIVVDFVPLLFLAGWIGARWPRTFGGRA